jgi:hypothetical protein
MKVVVKPQKTMDDWIAAHGYVPKNELPKKLRHIPHDQIWIRRDEYDRKTRRNQILHHEKRELGYMKCEGLSYEKAHRKTIRHERSYP